MDGNLAIGYKSLHQMLEAQGYFLFRTLYTEDLTKIQEGVDMLKNYNEIDNQFSNLEILIIPALLAFNGEPHGIVGINKHLIYTRERK